MSRSDQENYQTNLKEKISLNSSELYELAHNHQKFMAVVRKFNDEAKNKIDFELPQDALIYLAEAERVLEYAASCGKNIDRNLIICILHNEACCYQKIWDLEKCSNYIEALIYNFHENLQSWQTTPVSQQNSFYKSNSSISHDFMGDIQKKSWNFRLQLSKYQLQFCAINSQLRNHKTALKSGLKGIKIIKSILSELAKVAKDHFMSWNKNQIENDSLSEETFDDFKAKIKTLEGISQIDDSLKIQKFDNFVVSAKYYLGKWNIRKLQKNNEAIKENLKNFSIGTIMQLKPITFQENRQSTIDIEKWLDTVYEQKNKTEMFLSETYLKIIQKILLLSMSYFTVATEMRLLSNQKFGRNQEARKESRQFKESQLYHLIALILPCIYVPFDMLYVRHILASFNNHNTLTIDSALSMPQNHQSLILKQEFDPLGLAECKDYFTKVESQIIMGKPSRNPSQQKKHSTSKSQKTKTNMNSQRIDNQSLQMKKKSASQKSSSKNSLKHSRNRGVNDKSKSKNKKSKKKDDSKSKKTKSIIQKQDLGQGSSKQKNRQQYFMLTHKSPHSKSKKICTGLTSKNKDIRSIQTRQKKLACEQKQKKIDRQKSKRPSKQKVRGYYKKNIDNYYF